MTDYVTRGTVQFKIFPPAAGGVDPLEKVEIAPTDDYALKHKNKRYVILIGDPPPPNPPNLQSIKGLNVEYAFAFLPHLRDILMKAALRRTCLEIVIDDGSQIIGVTMPATS